MGGVKLCALGVGVAYQVVCVVVGVVFLFCSVCVVFRYTGVRDVKQLVSEPVIFYSGCHQVC